MASRTRGITIEINGDVTKLDKSLSAVNSTLKTTSAGLKDIDKLLKLDPSNTELLAQKQEYLAKAIEGTKEKLDREKQALEQMKNTEGFDRSSEQAKALERQIVADEEALKSLQKETKNLPTAFQASMKEAGAKVSEVGEKIGEVGDKVKDAGKKLTTHVTLPLAAVGAAGVKSFAEVDKTMQLTNKTMGNTQEEADLLNRAMKDAAANSTFGMKDAAEATLNFARAGLDAEQAAAALAPSMNLAAGEGGNLDTVSAGLTATINGFHGSFDEAGHYADVFAAACNNSALDVDSLSNAMSVAAPIFSAAGYAVDDAALYMGVMANNGIEADKAANSLKTGIAKLVSPAKEGAEMMEKLGISVTNSDGSMKDSVQVQQELHDAFANLSESEQIAAASAIFGKNQMAPWLALINTAPEDVGLLNDSLQNCAGTTDEMATAMMSGFGGSLESLKSSIDVLVTSIGEALAPTVQKVADFIQNLVDKFNALTPEQQQTIVTIGLVVAAIGPLLMILGTVMSTVKTITTTIGGMIVLLGNPLTLPILGVIAAVAAVIAIGVALYKNWDKIKAFAAETVGKIKENWDAFKKNTAETFENAKKAAVDKAKALKDGAVQKAQELKEGIAQRVTGAKEAAINKFNELKDGAVQKVLDMKNSAVQKVQDLKDGAVQKIQDMKDGVVQKFTDIKDGALGKFDDIKSGIKDRLDAAKNTVSDIVDGIKGLFNFEWHLPHLKVPHFSWTWTNIGGIINIPNITIDWYKKAMDVPRILKNATIFGAAGGQLLGGGEAGEEVVSGKNTLLEMIKNAVRSVIADAAAAIEATLGSGIQAALQKMTAVTAAAQTMIQNYSYGDINITVYGAEGQDVTELARIIKEDIRHEMDREEAVFA